jgi:hypothetical protein
VKKQYISSTFALLWTLISFLQTLPGTREVGIRFCIRSLEFLFVLPCYFSTVQPSKPQMSGHVGRSDFT